MFIKVGITYVSQRNLIFYLMGMNETGCGNTFYFLFCITVTNGEDAADGWSVWGGGS